MDPPFIPALPQEVLRCNVRCSLCRNSSSRRLLPLQWRAEAGKFGMSKQELHRAVCKSIQSSAQQYTAQRTRVYRAVHNAQQYTEQRTRVYRAVHKSIQSSAQQYTAQRTRVYRAVHNAQQYTEQRTRVYRAVHMSIQSSAQGMTQAAELPYKQKGHWPDTSETCSLLERREGVLRHMEGERGQGTRLMTTTTNHRTTQSLPPCSGLYSPQPVQLPLVPAPDPPPPLCQTASENAPIRLRPVPNHHVKKTYCNG